MTSLGKDCYIGTLHYKALDPPPAGSNDLQGVCNIGNTTTTGINCLSLDATTGDITTAAGNISATLGDISAFGNIDAQNGNITAQSNLRANTGQVETDTIAPVSGTITTFSREYRGDIENQSLSVAGPIPDTYVRGDCVSIRVGTASGVWSLPTGIEGNHFWFINSSGNPQRLTAAIGGTLDGLAPPNFINLTGAAPGPYAIKLLCIRGNQWYSSNS